MPKDLIVASPYHNRLNPLLFTMSMVK